LNYREITAEEEIHDLINELRVRYKNLSQLIPAGEYETTMGGKKVLNVYYRLEPVYKVEGEEEVLNRFVEQFRQAAKGYSAG
jgi:hypothetical protein